MPYQDKHSSDRPGQGQGQVQKEDYIQSSYGIRPGGPQGGRDEADEPTSNGVNANPSGEYSSSGASGNTGVGVAGPGVGSNAGSKNQGK